MNALRGAVVLHKEVDFTVSFHNELHKESPPEETTESQCWCRYENLWRHMHTLLNAEVLSRKHSNLQDCRITAGDGYLTAFSLAPSNHGARNQGAEFGPAQVSRMHDIT